MTETMHYATYGRNRRRPNRRVVANNKPQVQKPSASTIASQSRQSQNEKMDPKGKAQTSSFNTNKRRSDPDGAYCLSREEHSNNVKDSNTKSRERNSSRGKQRGVAAPKEKSHPSSASAPTPRRKSGSDANLSRQSRSVHRSPSPQPSRANTKVSAKSRSSSSRPSRSRTESFNEQRQRSSSVKSCRSTKSCKSTKSEAPTLTSELTGFDLKMSNKAAAENKKSGAKNYLMSKISGLSILGGCKKKQSARRLPVPRNAHSRSLNAATSISTPRTRRYQLEDGSCTYMSEDEMSSSDSSSSYQSESESEFNSSYESFSSSSSSSNDSLLKSMSEAEEEGIYHALKKSTSSFVEDEFDTDDEEENYSVVAEERGSASSKSPSISTKSRALIQTLEAENAALRCSIVALRSDWEVIVNKMARLQDGDDSPPDEVTEKSPNLEAVRALRDHAMEAMKQKQAQDLVERNKRETDLKSCIECVEELLCENERLYDKILGLSQEREDILKELTALRKQAVTSLEESHHSLLADEAKSQDGCIDDITSLLTKTKKDLAEDKEDLNNMENEIMQLVRRVMSQRFEQNRSSGVNNDEKEVSPAEESCTTFSNSALVIRRASSRRSSGSSAYSSHKNESTRRSSSYSNHSRRRSSCYSEYSDSSRPEGDSDFSSDSESEEEEEKRESNIINASMNSLFDGSGPSFSSSEDRDNEANDLDVIYEKSYDSDYDSESSSESSTKEYRCRTPSPMCPKKKSWYNAVRSVASRIRNKDKRRKPRYYYAEDEDDDPPIDSSDRRSSNNTILSDVELTHYPEIIPRCSPSTASRGSSRSSSRSSTRSRSASRSRQLSSSFTSIPEDEELTHDGDGSKQYSKEPNRRSSASYAEDDDEEENPMELPEYNESNFSIGTPLQQNENGELQASYVTQSPGNTSVTYIVASSSVEKPHRDTASTCASVSHGDSEFDEEDEAVFADNATCCTSSSESTKERKGISITVVSRSSRFLTLPSSRSHTYMTFFTASLLKNQIDEVLYEQYHESMREIIGSMSSVATEVASGAKKRKKQKYQGDLNEDGERHGYGIYKSKNGNEYRGEWLHNKREGLGVVKIGNGDVFEGQFEHNMKNGVGVYHYIDGECDLSRYKDDRRAGESLRYTKDRKRAYLLSEDLSSKEITIADAAMHARAMGVIIQL